MGWGDLIDRFDPLPLQAGFFLNQLEVAGQVELVPFRSIASGFVNGFAAGREQQSFEQTANVQLRPTNLQPDGRWTFDKATYLESQDIPAIAKSPRVGSIIFNNTNSQTLVGKTGVWRDKGGITPYLSNHMTEIQMADGFDPDCYAAVINIYRERRVFFNLCTNWNNQSGFSGDRLRALPVPKLTVHQQNSIGGILRKSRQSAVAKEREAAALLASIDDYLLVELGIALPPETENTLANRTFRVAVHKLSGWRFDPTFYSHKYVGLSAALEMQAHRRLGEVCIFSSENWDQDSLFVETFPYLEISEIDIGTGAIGTVADTPIIEAPSRARMIVRQDDILVSTTRPSRGAIALADEKLQYPIIASTGFAVIRKVAESLIEREYLFYVLRSKIGLWQMEQRSSGGNYPAINPTELKRLIIPTPDLERQRRIVAGCKHRISEALSLRSKATAELEAAKRQIEAILLGGAA